jgi:hypothetical protein
MKEKRIKNFNKKRCILESAQKFFGEHVREDGYVTNSWDDGHIVPLFNWQASAVLPWNLALDILLSGEYDPSMRTIKRFAGWLKAAASLSHLAKILEKGTGNGMLSDRTKLHPFDLFLKKPSPGKAERELRQLKKRVNAVLKPYGLYVSWAVLGEVYANYYDGMDINELVNIAAGKTIQAELDYLSGGRFNFFDNPEAFLSSGVGVGKIKEMAILPSREDNDFWEIVVHEVTKNGLNIQKAVQRAKKRVLPPTVVAKKRNDATRRILSGLKTKNLVKKVLFETYYITVREDGYVKFEVENWYYGTKESKWRDYDAFNDASKLSPEKYVQVLNELRDNTVPPLEYRKLKTKTIQTANMGSCQCGNCYCIVREDGMIRYDGNEVWQCSGWQRFYSDDCRHYNSGLSEEKYLAALTELRE